MQKNKLFFSKEIKLEILEKKLSTKKQIISETYAMIIAKCKFQKEKINFISEVEYVYNHLSENLKKIENLIYEEKFNNNIYKLSISKAEFAKLNIDKFDKKALLRGFFLSSGYIKDPKKSYSIDFFIEDENVCKKLHNILIDMGKKAYITKQNSKFLVYIRNCEDILDIIYYLDAINSFFKYESVTIDKENNIKIIRNMNYELANETKMLLTSKNQIDMIKEIDKKIGLNTLTDSLKEAAILRLKNEEASLSQLADMLKITKSGIRNRFRRIKEIYESI